MRRFGRFPACTTSTTTLTRAGGPSLVFSGSLLHGSGSRGLAFYYPLTGKCQKPVCSRGGRYRDCGTSKADHPCPSRRPNYGEENGPLGPISSGTIVTIPRLGQFFCSSYFFLFSLSPRSETKNVTLSMGRSSMYAQRVTIRASRNILNIWQDHPQ